MFKKDSFKEEKKQDSKVQDTEITSELGADGQETSEGTGETGTDESNKAENEEKPIEEYGEFLNNEAAQKIEEAIKQKDEYMAALQRMAAEFDNYKKRTAREKESFYYEVTRDVVKVFIPVLDNLERAAGAAAGNTETKESKDALAEGVNMVIKQFKDVLKALGVEEIKSVGETFNPELHNAVMHIEDDSLESNTVAEEFQKGYIIKDKVIRHSMVKVAN